MRSKTPHPHSFADTLQTQVVYNGRVTILGIETSCDETAAAIVQDGTKILSNVVASSQDLQAKYGGIVPEVAARKQAEYMIPVLTEAFTKAPGNLRGFSRAVQSEKVATVGAELGINAIAVTIGPGLIGSLWVGVETAKVLSYVWQKPLVPVNHLVGHIYSGWLDPSTQRLPQFPLVALIASGGHTDLVVMKGHGRLDLISSTLDDAVGEAFDKSARILGLGYPGGPEIEKAAQMGDPSAFDFPRPMLASKDFMFSYSGIKTSVLYKVRDLGDNLPRQQVADLAASFQIAAFEPLIAKTIRAARQHHARSILVTGGVAANQKLKQMFAEKIAAELPEVSLHIPPLKLATDNAAYIAAAAYFLYDQLKLDPTHRQELEKIFLLEPDPNLKVTDNLLITHENR